ncbi:hypothetical protein Atc_1626 [Acidithiobacillus caldus SM-1]|uniref:Uncharacterized protein n=1 Tax=Acidithiobacillus caldus (strain SM-1) TaxID=990288 RepID=F9ZNL0_ACICS|nr:hypothetical protein Atc_1626 [Acidithiobacillus caldus SM-1]
MTLPFHLHNHPFLWQKGQDKPTLAFCKYAFRRKTLWGTVALPR